MPIFKALPLDPKVIFSSTLGLIPVIFATNQPHSKIMESSTGGHDLHQGGLKRPLTEPEVKHLFDNRRSVFKHFSELTGHHTQTGIHIAHR